MFERNYCDQLNLLEKAGAIKSYKTQVSFNLVIEGKHICRHIVDFLVMNKKGIVEVHETKGYVTRDWTLKRKLFEVLYPAIPYIVITNERRKYDRQKSKRF